MNHYHPITGLALVLQVVDALLVHKVAGLGEAVLVGEEALLAQVVVGGRHAGEGRRGEAALLALRLAHVPHRLSHVAAQLGVHEALEGPMGAAIATWVSILVSLSRTNTFSSGSSYKPFRQMASK